MTMLPFVPTCRSSRQGLGLLSAVLAIAVSTSAAQAQSTATWTGGGGSGNWSNASNWTLVPTTSGSWALVFGGTTQTTGTNTIGTITVSSLSFTNDGSAGKSALFTLSGSTLALSSASITTTATNGGSLGSNAGDVVGNTLSLTGVNTALLGTGHNLTLTGNASGSGSLVMAGAATSQLFLSGSNSYSGGTTISAGAIQNGLQNSTSSFSDTAFGTGDVTVNSGGSAVIRNGSQIANNFTISGTGASNSADYGAIRGSFGTSGTTATLSGTVTLAGNATVTSAGSAGVSGSKLVLAGPVLLGANALTLNPKASGANPLPIEVTGTISGSGSVVVSGSASSVLLSAANQYSGGTTIQASTLRVGGATALGSGTVAVVGGTLDLNGQALSIGTLTGSSGGLITTTVSGSASLTTNSSVASTYGGTITDGSGTVSLIKTGTGALYLTGSNGYTGGTRISGGIVQNGLQSSLTDFNNNAFGTGDVVVDAGGSAVIRNGSVIANNFTISGTGAANAADYGAIRGSFGTSGTTATITGAVTLSGNATVTTAASSGVTGSKLVLAGPVHLGGNTLTLNPKTSGSSPVPIAVEGVIDGSGAVVLNGLSAAYLNAANTYTGPTTVMSGTLGGDGSVTGLVTVKSGAAISPGSAENTFGSFGVGSLQLDAGSTAVLAIGGTSATLYDQIVATTSVTYGGALSIDFLTNGFLRGDHWQLFDAPSSSGNFSTVSASGAYGSLSFNYAGNGAWVAEGGSLGAGESLLFFTADVYGFKSGELVLVPEPSTIAIAGVGIVLVGLQMSRRRRRE